MAERDLAPDDIPDLAAWWDGTDPATIRLTNGRVDQWTAKGSLALPATQASEGWRPLVETEAITGKTALSFDGYNYRMGFDGSKLPVDNLTVVVIGSLKADTYDGDWRRAFGYGDWGSNGLQIGRRGTDATVAEIALGIGGGVNWKGVDRTVIETRSNGQATLFVDGRNAGTAGYGNLFGNVGWIGRGVEYEDLWPGLIRHILVYARHLSDEEVAQLFGWGSWSANKAGADLPDGYPYRNAPPKISAGGIILPRRRPVILLPY